MTVVVRPVPSRVARNGIRPFRVAVPANGIRQYTLKTWRPPVPEPLAPAPLLGPQTLLGLGALVLAQIWGWLSARPVTKSKPTPEGGSNISGTLPPPGNTVGATFIVDRIAGSYSYSNNVNCTNWTDLSAGSFRIHNTPNVTQAVWDPEVGECGVKKIRWRVTYTSGDTIYLNGATTTYGYKNDTTKYITSWAGPGAVPFVPSGGGVLPLPDGWAPPEIEPETAPLPIPTPKPTLPVTVPASPAVEPVPEVAPAPVEPGPSRPPAVTPIPLPARPSGPVRPAGPTPINNGVIVPPKPAPIPVTPSDVVFPVPGGAPVGGPGQSPKPDLVGIAQEVGKIERKLEGLLNPKDPEVNPVPNWLEDLAKIWELLSALEGGGKYLLVEPCDPDGDGEFVKREVEYQGALGMLGLLSNKIDALAELQQAAKDLRQPTCPRPRPQGQLVTANFRSMAHSPASRQYLRKQLRYRDNAGRSEAEHVAHWEQFEWQAGPAIVTSAGASWGIVKVWAADPEEGRRVIRHAAAIAGVNLSVKEHRWLDSASSDPRFGKPGRMAVERDMDGSVCVSKRVGSSGQPSWMLNS